MVGKISGYYDKFQYSVLKIFIWDVKFNWWGKLN